MVDTTYNGWRNWITWNLSLWIQNDEGLYKLARRCKRWPVLVAELSEAGYHQTPDGARFDDPDADVSELQTMLEEL